jgi:hypothetical protein
MYEYILTVEIVELMSNFDSIMHHSFLPGYHPRYVNVQVLRGEI